MRKIIVFLFTSFLLYGTTSQVEVQLTVVDNNLDWVNLQYPAEGSIRVGANYDVYSRVYEPGVTNAEGQGSNIQAWIGYSSSNSDPSGNGWQWVTANYHTDANNNDEYKANIGTVITSAGTYYYASRFSIDGGATYKYGGYSSGGGGLWDGSTYVSGVLTINANVAPVLTDISNQTMTEDNALSLNIAATDADNDQLTYTITGGSSETVSASIDGTTLTLTPASNYFTTTALNFILKVADTFGDSDTSQFSVTVSAVNDAPVIASLSDQEGSEGVEITFNITATDVDGDDLTWSSANLPSGAVFTDNDNGTSTFTWTPNYTQAGVYTNITFIVDDGQGSTASLVVNPKKNKISN